MLPAWTLLSLLKLSAVEGACTCASSFQPLTGCRKLLAHASQGLPLPTPHPTMSVGLLYVAGCGKLWPLACTPPPPLDTDLTFSEEKLNCLSCSPDDSISKGLN